MIIGVSRLTDGLSGCCDAVVFGTVNNERTELSEILEQGAPAPQYSPPTSLCAGLRCSLVSNLGTILPVWWHRRPTRSLLDNVAAAGNGASPTET